MSQLNFKYIYILSSYSYYIHIHRHCHFLLIPLWIGNVDKSLIYFISKSCLLLIKLSNDIWKKPSDLTFMHDSIVDPKQILTDELDINDRHIEFQLTNITCGAPTKSFIKGT